MRSLFKLKLILSYVYLKDSNRCTQSLMDHVRAVCERSATDLEVQAYQGMLAQARLTSNSTSAQFEQHQHSGSPRISASRETKQQAKSEKKMQKMME